MIIPESDSPYNNSPGRGGGGITSVAQTPAAAITHITPITCDMRASQVSHSHHMIQNISHEGAAAELVSLLGLGRTP